MIEMYNTNIETNETKKVKKYQKGNWINLVSPSEEEIKEVCKNVNISQDFIRYALDYEEKARIDIEDEDNTTLFVIDVPVLEKEGDTLIYSTMPIGIITVRDDFLITVSIKKNEIIQKLTKNKNIVTYKKSRFILQILYSNSSLYLELKLLRLEKSLVYFTTSLKSNEIVMEKTMRGKIIKLYEEDEDLLEDAITENKQAIEMAKIYSDILNGTMDAYASIISNNLNRVMKYLTSITIILAIPTMVSSFWGMNVPVPMQKNPFGFIIILIFSILITLMATLWLSKKNMLK